MLVVGATAVIQHAKARPRQSLALAADVFERKPPKLAAVALANKTARIAWKLMVTGEATTARSMPESAAAAIRDQPAGSSAPRRRSRNLQEREDGGIDRSESETLRGSSGRTWSLGCLELASRKPSWPAVMSDRNNRPDI